MGVNKSIRDSDPLLWTSFGISIFSAAFGIAKLLKNGPIKLIKKNGKIAGYGSPGFILLMVIVAGNMIEKATWMVFGFQDSAVSGNSFHSENYSNIVWIWAYTSILPQLLLVSHTKQLLFKKY